MEKIQIAEKAQALFIKNERFKTTRITVNFYLPLENEYYSELAMLPFFLTSCCASQPTPAELSCYLNELYGSVLSGTTEKIGDNRRIGFTVVALDDQYSIDGSKPMAGAAKLLCDVIFAPSIEGGSFKEEDFNREKRLFCELVEAEKNDKRQYARTRLESELFPDEPYGLADLGNIAGAEAISKESLFAAWQNMLKYANIGINVIGANLPEDFLAEFRRNLENLCREPQELNYQSKQLQKAELREVYDREEITQGKLCIGLCAPSGKSAKERAAATMANDLLGGGTYSKLFSVVREKLHLCYYCASRISRLKGYMVIDSGVDFANAQKAKDEILNQLELLKSGDFTDQDMESSRKSLCNAVKTAQDTASVIDRWYSGRFLDEELISPEEYRSSVAALKREDVIKAASGIEPHTVYYMLPKEELK